MDVTNVMIYTPSGKLYVHRIDSTHCYIGYSPELNSLCVYHIEQLSHTSYYQDLKSWLHNQLSDNDFTGRSYD